MGEFTDATKALHAVQMGMRAIQVSTILVVELKRAAEIFRGYEEHHRREAESGSDNVRGARLKKADANAAHAAKIEAVLNYVETGDASGLRRNYEGASSTDAGRDQSAAEESGSDADRPG